MHYIPPSFSLYYSQEWTTNLQWFLQLTFIFLSNISYIMLHSFSETQWQQWLHIDKLRSLISTRLKYMDFWSILLHFYNTEFVSCTWRQGHCQMMAPSQPVSETLRLLKKALLSKVKLHAGMKHRDITNWKQQPGKRHSRISSIIEDFLLSCPSTLFQNWYDLL